MGNEVGSLTPFAKMMTPRERHTTAGTESNEMAAASQGMKSHRMMRPSIKGLRRLATMRTQTGKYTRMQTGRNICAALFDDDDDLDHLVDGASSVSAPSWRCDDENAKLRDENMRLRAKLQQLLSMSLHGAGRDAGASTSAATARSPHVRFELPTELSDERHTGHRSSITKSSPTPRMGQIVNPNLSRAPSFGQASSSTVPWATRWVAPSFESQEKEQQDLGIELPRVKPRRTGVRPSRRGRVTFALPDQLSDDEDPARRSEISNFMVLDEDSPSQASDGADASDL